MPIYEYECEKCGRTIDVLQKVSDPPPASCAHCGAEASLVRRVSRTSFVLKGGGWYADLYSSSKKDSKTSTETASGSTDNKPAPASSSSTASSGSGGGSSSTTSSAVAAAPKK